MRRLLALILLLQALHLGIAQAANHPLLQLVVTAPYLEMHSGPGRGYPVVYVVGRDEIAHGAVQPHGLVQGARSARRGGLGAARGSGEHRTRPRGAGADSALSGFRQHRWEVGAGYGVYNRQNLVTAYADFGITDSIDVEAVLQQALGTLDNRVHRDRSACATPSFPSGSGFRRPPASAPAISTSRTKCRPAPLESSNQMAYVSLGARGFITRRFMWRADWRHYVVFNNLNVNEELEEWKFGLAVFF